MSNEEARSIQVAIVDKLGVIRYKPVDENAKMFAQLLRADTISPRDIEFIKKLGFKVFVVSFTPKEL